MANNRKNEIERKLKRQIIEEKTSDILPYKYLVNTYLNDYESAKKELAQIKQSSGNAFIIAYKLENSIFTRIPSCEFNDNLNQQYGLAD